MVTERSQSHTKNKIALNRTKKMNAKVYLQHQKEDYNKMPKAPEYLK